MATISALWTRRSTRATTQVALGKASPHSANGRLVVIMWNQGSSFRGLFCRTVLRAQLGRSLA